MKGTRITYSARQLAFIKRRRKLTRRALHAAFVKAFPRAHISRDNIKALCTRRQWLTGRDGRFRKGVVPPNKGKKMPYNANSARTRFKKGGRTGRARKIYKPIGTERVSCYGYRERKIHDGRPMQSRWRAVHLLNWEAIHGPVPKDHCLKCLDGNKLNTDPSNWQLVPRAMLPRLNGRFGRSYDEAPAELKPSIMAVAKLEHELRQKSRERAQKGAA